MTAAKVPRILVIGGGFTGAAFALHLLRHNADLAAEIEIIEPRPLLGAGLAYSSEDPTHRINVAAARMALYAEDPTHFDTWFRASAEAAADPAAFVEDGRAYPRRVIRLPPRRSGPTPRCGAKLAISAIPGGAMR